MNQRFQSLFQLLKVQLRFAMTGAFATGIDYVIYLTLVNRVFSPVISNLISYPCGALINFLLHRKFVFHMTGSTSATLALSFLVSLGGMGLSTGLIYLLTQMDFFATHQPITKLLSAGVVFFYNFFLKRFVFERKFV
jgi:putative flippase GtrA